MKNSVFLIVLLVSQGSGFSQKISPIVNDRNNITRQKSQNLTFTNDITLIRPLINTNDSNGGYYSEYYTLDFDFMYCGAVIKNTGTAVATHVFMKMEVRDNNNTITNTYYSDTVGLLNPGQTITVNIPGQLNFQPLTYSTSQLIFIAKSDSVDEFPANDQDTVPFTNLYISSWSHVSRSIYMTKSQEVGQSGGFQSGDFLGFTVSIKYAFHQIYYLMIDITEPWQDSLTMTAMIYRNGQAIDSANVYLPSPPQAGWAMSDGFYNNSFIEPGYLYYLGVKIKYKSGTHLIIGTDTSAYHNFNAETIAHIGGSWSGLNYVPLIQAICDPEGIDDLGHQSPARVYPNPVNGNLSLENVVGSGIEIYDISGKLVLTDARTASSRKLDLSTFAPGVYLIKIIGKDRVESRKIIIE
jgi:hypothetical protein